MRLVSSRVHFPGFRCSLGDQSINALVILKHIFQNEEQDERLERIGKNLAKTLYSEKATKF